MPLKPGYSRWRRSLTLENELRFLELQFDDWQEWAERQLEFERELGMLSPYDDAYEHKLQQLNEQESYYEEFEPDEEDDPESGCTWLSDIPDTPLQQAKYHSVPSQSVAIALQCTPG